jgi:fused signal recognition particle receptor
MIGCDMFGFGKKKKRDADRTDAVRDDSAPRAPEAVPDAPVPAQSRAAPKVASPAAQPAGEPPATTPSRGSGGSARARDMAGEPQEGRLARAIAEQAEAERDAQSKGRFLSGLKEGLARTREVLNADITELVTGRKEIDEDLLEELENLLLAADVGVPATARIIDDLSYRVKLREVSDPKGLLRALRNELREVLQHNDAPVRQPAPGRPQVILMVGVNGVGKTTTIGKLAKQLQAEGNAVMLAAGDTFRAAAVEQLQRWGERNDVPVIAQHSGADPASVIFDALQAVTARHIDVLIADTAGRLHTKSNLMEELRKIARVMKKIDPDAPHEVMLVVDATTGQNALHQAVQFNEVIPLTGITLTKLDGTAKGGILFAIADKLDVPFRFIGIGERIEDLRHFDADDFLDALLAP